MSTSKRATRLSLDLPAHLVRRVRVLAAVKDVTLRQVAIQALSEFVGRHERTIDRAVFDTDRA